MTLYLMLYCINLMFDALKKSLFLSSPAAILKKHKVSKTSDLITEQDFVQIMKAFNDLRQRKEFIVALQ